MVGMAVRSISLCCVGMKINVIVGIRNHIARGKEEHGYTAHATRQLDFDPKEASVEMERADRC
jgi:hypothetical protein